MSRLLGDRNLLVVALMGFSSGLPFLLTGQTLQPWFKEAGMSLTVIGFFSYLRLPYNLKFIWSPMLDLYVPPALGRRRGWLAATQIALILGLIGMSFGDPAQSTRWIAIFAFIVIFASATQDIAVDAYRREILPEATFGLGTSFAITGFRIAMLLASTGALVLADHMSWPSVYRVMAACMSLGLVTTLIAREPRIEHQLPKSLKDAVVEPFQDFFKRPDALWLLAFIFLYKFGDNVASAFTTLFYIDIGYTKSEIGTIGKIFGVTATICGGVIGGSAMIRFGLKRSLWIFGILQALANFCYAWLAWVGPTLTPGGRLPALATTIIVENLMYGMGATAIVTFMAMLTNKRFTATQYALLSSLMGLAAVVVPGPAGWIKETLALTWVQYYLVSCAFAVPGLLLLMRVGRWADVVERENQKP